MSCPPRTASASSRLDVVDARAPERGDRTRRRTASGGFAILPLAGDREPRGWPAPAGPALVLLGDAAAVAGGFALRGATTVAVLAVAAAFVVMVGVTGGYRLPLTTSALEDVPALLTRLALAAFVGGAVWGESTGELLVAGALAGLVLVATRSVTYAVVRLLRARGRLGDRTVVVGNGPLTAELVTALTEHPSYGVQPVALLHPADPDRDDEPLAPAAIGDALTDLGVRRMIVSYCECADADMVPLLRAAVASDVQLHVVPRFFDLGIATRGKDEIWGIPLLRVQRAALRRRAWSIRRATEVAIASVLLLFASPILAAISVAVRLSSPGPILFRQLRTGQAGRSISVVKFRTLRVEEDAGVGTADGVIDLRQDGLSVQTRRQESVERRLTGIGGFLRSTGLDELPQLWSVVKGDMSLVGPRPEELTYAGQFESSIRGYGERHRLPVGLTGWAQVHGLRGETSIAQRVRFDNQYIEHWSMWRDVVIALRTVGVLVRRFVRREA
jgi:exopolysaccharide biosynthesis polyprenyl glycosylphosphotransferase